MITEMKFIPVTADSTPFAAAAAKCGFDRIGYVEDEYFQSGTANVYREEPVNKAVPYIFDAPYTTRLIVRRPADVNKFSGNVVIEILNSSANIDIDRMWVDSWPFFTRNGDIFIGISSKGHVVDTLKAFDPKRYEAINWNNPDPESANKKPAPGPMKQFPQYEMGLFWDMLVDLAKLLRSDDDKNFLREYGDFYLYLTGWSQSTIYVNRIIKSFAYLPENCKDRPLFDGYLDGGGFGSLMGLNNNEGTFFGTVDGYPTGGMMGAPDPFIAVNTESENRTAYWCRDYDEDGYKSRIWEIAGATHNSKYNLVVYYGEEDLKMLEGLGIYNGYYGVDGDALDLPYEPVFSAAWAALYAWAREGIPAPHAERIETHIKKEREYCIGGGLTYVSNRTDALGNCLGGIRTPAINYPTGKYVNISLNPDGRVNGSFGKVLPYSPAMLKEMYGSLENYKNLIEEDYTRTVAEGFLLEGDREAYVAHCVECARERGLE